MGETYSTHVDNEKYLKFAITNLKIVAHNVVGGILFQYEC